jgi:simple sugar transport system permease protein
VNNSLGVVLVVAGIVYGTPLLIAGLGELLAERSGVLNLGVEGMMLTGAVAGFWLSQRLSGPGWLALAAALLLAMAAGAAMGCLHALITVTFRANQVVSGLALTIYGGAIGLSSYLASVTNLANHPGRHQFGKIDVFGLENVPVAGPILFHQDAVVYLSWALVAATVIYLRHTRAGLHLQAVGENPHAADSMSINVTRYRYAHTVAGGALAGAAGSYYALAISPSWTDGMTAGAGWIAIGLVIFAFWRPLLLLAGAYLFGVVTSLGFTLQARGVTLAPELFSALPYILTILALVLISTVVARRRLGAPAALGEPYLREEA